MLSELPASFPSKVNDDDQSLLIDRSESFLHRDSVFNKAHNMLENVPSSLQSKDNEESLLVGRAESFLRQDSMFDR